MAAFVGLRDQIERLEAEVSQLAAAKAESESLQAQLAEVQQGAEGERTRTKELAKKLVALQASETDLSQKLAEAQAAARTAEAEIQTLTSSQGV